MIDQDVGGEHQENAEFARIVDRVKPQVIAGTAGSNGNATARVAEMAG